MAKRKYSPKPDTFTVFNSPVGDSSDFYLALKTKGKIRVPGLGDFSLRDIPAREGWNPSTKESMIVPAYTKIHFKADPKFTRYFR